jgi:shikimate kinase
MATDSRSSELLRQRGIWAIFLVGFMGAGKTTVGQAAAKRLAWRFVDLDDEVEAQAGCSVAEIFRRDGEAEFRRRELEALKRLRDAADWRDGTVIALGGGAFCQPDIRKLLRNTGQPSVFLDAPVSELLMRCRNSAVVRPLAKDEDRFRQLYAERQGVYAEANLKVSTVRRSTARIVKVLLDEVAGFSAQKLAAGKPEGAAK